MSADQGLLLVTPSADGEVRWAYAMNAGKLL